MKAIRVHVIDDEADVLTSLAMMLDVLGYATKQWISSGEFLEHADLIEGDMVLTDLRMPGFDGFEVHRRVSAAGKTTPFILMTGHGTAETLEEARSRGFCAGLLKPFDLSTLAAALDCANALCGPQRGRVGPDGAEPAHLSARI